MMRHLRVCVRVECITSIRLTEPNGARVHDKGEHNHDSDSDVDDVVALLRRGYCEDTEERRREEGRNQGPHMSQPMRNTLSDRCKG